MTTAPHPESDHRAVETWVEGTAGPLWAAVHRPADRPVVGVAVVAGSVGLEAITMHRATVRLCHELARRGIVAVRFAWTGDGDSADLPLDVAPSDVWRADLTAVVDLARRLVPGAPVHLLATRLGTTIDPGVRVDSLTHIEPVSGRTFIRSHSMLRKMGTPVDVVPADLGVELSGTLWNPAQAADVRRLKPLEQVHGVQPRVVPVSPEQLTTFYSVAPQLAEVPLEALEQAADGVVGTTPYVPADVEPVRTVTRVVDGREITEELTTVGPHRLPAVVARPVDETPRNAVVLTAPGAEPRSAPVGLFARLARSAAANGAVSIRADRRGLGELASTVELHSPDVYSLDAVDDVLETVRAAKALAPGRPVVAVGACIGAWLYLKASPTAGLDRVVAFDALAWDVNPDHFTWIPGTYEIAYGGKRFASNLRTPPGIGALSRRQQLTFAAVGKAKRVAAVTLSFAVRHCPRGVWAALASRRIVQDPMPMLEGIPAQTRTDLHFGPVAVAAFERTRGVQSTMAARRHGKQVNLYRWPDLDHSIFAHRARVTATDVVLDAVRTTR